MYNFYMYTYIQKVIVSKMLNVVQKLSLGLKDTNLAAGGLVLKS